MSLGTDVLAPTNNLTGLVGKIARTVIYGEDVPYLFSGVDKGTLKYGKYLEVQLRKSAQGSETYNALGIMSNSNKFPAFSDDYNFDGGSELELGALASAKDEQKTLYFDEWIKNVYATTIDYDDIDESSQNEGVANEQAAKLVDALYQGATKDKNLGAINSIVEAIATAGEANKAIVKVGDVAEITDYETANEWLALVKKIAKKVRRGSGAVNPADSKAEIPAPRVIMLTPADNITGVDVYKRAPTLDNDFTRFDVDEVIEYDPDRYASMNGATVIADERYFQFYEKERIYKENDALMQGSAGNAILCTLATRNMYALCPLFNAAVIGQTQA
jgi:hypothetical protein